MKPLDRIGIPLATLIVVAGQTASAQEVNVQSLISPNEQSVEFGILGALDNNRKAGMYTGLSEIPALPIADFSIINRDEQTGTWFRAIGTDLGFDNRGLHLDYERQGSWKYSFDFDQTYKLNPLEITSGLTNFDSNTQTVNGTSPRQIDLSTDRYNAKLGLGRRFSKDLDLQLSYRSEHKNGDRQFGFRSGGQNIFFLVDPIDQFIHEIDAKLNYTTAKLQLTGGFLGSFFQNKHKALYQSVNNTDIALPPDNEAYNIYLSGGYNFTPATRGAFKLSYNLMTQSDDFFRPTDGLTGNNRTDLGGHVENYLATGNISSRITKDLTLLGRVRYEGRHDNTPAMQYVGISADRTGKNLLFDRDRVTADGEATYRLPDNYRVTGAVKYEYWDREVPDRRQASWRSRTDEYSGRAQISKTISESLGGNIAYIYSVRTGNAFQDANSGTNLIDPIHWGDRERNQWRLNLSWAPMDKLSVQTLVDGSLDTYHSDVRQLGPENGTSHNAAIDVAYQLTRDWSLTAFVSRNEVSREQKQFDNEGQLRGAWTAFLRNVGYSGGIGVRGTPKDRLKVGADIQYSYDKNEYDLVGARSDVVDLPDIAYRQLGLKLFADYEMSQNSSVKFSYAYTHLENSDFTYDINVYVDGTVIRIPDRENSHFVGLSYRYRW